MTSIQELEQDIKKLREIIDTFGQRMVSSDKLLQDKDRAINERVNVLEHLNYSVQVKMVYLEDCIAAYDEAILDKVNSVAILVKPIFNFISKDWPLFCSVELNTYDGDDILKLEYIKGCNEAYDDAILHKEKAATILFVPVEELLGIWEVGFKK